MLPPVVEDVLLLGHLPLVVLHIVPVENAEGDGQRGGDHQHGHQDRADVRREETENYSMKATSQNWKDCILSPFILR